MTLRTFAQAVSLVLAVACTTSGTQRASDHTGAMWPQRATASSQPASTPDAAAQETTAQTQQGTETASPPPAASAGPESSTITGDAQQPTGSTGADTGSTATGTEPSAGTMGGSSEHGHMGSEHGAAGSSGAMGDMKGHGDDQTVSGRVSKASGKSLSITSAQGGSKTLRIVPETVVTVNGKTAKPSQVKPGQPVRASYMEHDGENVAVRIDVGRTPAAGASGGATSNGAKVR
jgi:hypothetical protein